MTTPRLCHRLRSFLRGFGSVIDLAGLSWDDHDERRYPIAATDEEAIRRDWEAVGDDLRAAIGHVERAHAQLLKKEKE